MSQSKIPLDIFGQVPTLYGLYTQLCFMFPLESTSLETQTDVAAYLRAGLERLAKHVPWIASDVTVSDTGYYSVEIADAVPTLVVKDLRDKLPVFETMRQNQFPFSILDESVIAPCPTLANGKLDAYPVSMFQANFVEGGLLLVVNVQHTCMDFRGLAQFMELFTKACQKIPFSTEELHVANLTSFPLRPNDHEEAAQEDAKSGSSQAFSSIPEVEPLSSTHWVYFSFSSDALRRLKNTAEQDKSVDFISTDDALTALLWQAIMRSRRHRFQDLNIPSTFKRQANARKHVGAPHAYMGNMIYTSSVVLPINEILTSSLGNLSSLLRQALEPTPSIEYQVRSNAQQMRQQLESPGSASARERKPMPPNDIILSSWANDNCCHLDFGGSLGLPEVVKRPGFDIYEGLFYFMPKARNEEISVAVSIAEDDLTELQADEIWCRYAEFVG